MASSYRFYSPEPQFFNGNGTPYANGTLTFYETGTTTPKNTYPTEADALAGTNANANPLTLNSLGAAPVEVWMVGQYRVILKNAAAATIWDRDPFTQTQLQDTAVIGTVATLRATEGAFDGETITLGGYYAIGDSPSRVMYWDAASTATDDGGRVFKVTAVTTGRWKASQDDFMDLRWWGCKFDCPDYPDAISGTDDYDALNRALNSSLRTSGLSGTNINHAGTFLFPEGGVARCDSTLHCKSVFNLIGGSNHLTADGACQIRFPVDTAGMVIHSHNTDSTGTVASGSSAAGSVLDGILLRGSYWPSSTGTTGHGIWLRGRATLRHCSFRGFAENGVNIVAGSGTGGFTEGNANNWYMDAVLAINNGGHGFFVDGADVNAGLGSLCNAIQNGGWGIYEGSFLGNVWNQPHTSGNTTGSYKGDSLNACSVWVGPYTEGGQPDSEWDQANLIIGGIPGSFDATKLGVLLTANLGFLLCRKGYRTSQDSTAGNTLEVHLGGDPDNGVVLYADHETYSPNVHQLHYVTPGDLNFDYASGNATFKITGPVTTTSFGRASAVLHALMVPKLFVGSLAAASCRQITTQTWPPSSGEFAKGDVIFNISAAAAGDPGGMCTTTGVAGSTAVFNAFANLDA